MTRSDIGAKLVYKALEQKFETLEDIAFEIIEARTKAVKVKKEKEKKKNIQNRWWAYSKIKCHNR